MLANCLDNYLRRQEKIKKAPTNLNIKNAKNNNSTTGKIVLFNINYVILFFWKLATFSQNLSPYLRRFDLTKF